MAPTCFKGCIAPPISPYLVITPKEPEYNTGAIVGVSCTSGFSLQGNATLQCQEDLTWGSNLPQCAIGKIKTIRIQKYSHFTHWYFVKLLGLFGIIAKVLSNCLFYAQYIHITVSRLRPIGATTLYYALKMLQRVFRYCANGRKQ